MITRLENLDPEARTWTINDRVNANYFSWVRLDENPLVINLYWKEDDKADKQFIGSYRLDLPALLKSGYLREDANHPGEVFLRFQRN